jgi:hypothetical protein
MKITNPRLPAKILKTTMSTKSGRNSIFVSFAVFPVFVIDRDRCEDLPNA